MKYVIIIAIAVVLLIPISAYATTSVEKIMSDYRLKGDAYDELGYSYMAFLNYDKANWQQGKDNSYNEWMEYKTYVEENEKYFGGNYGTIIPRAFSIGDFEGILIYSELAEKNFPEEGSRYGERVIALNFLGKFEEAKILTEQGRQLIVNPDNAEGSWFDIYGKMINFYKNAQYKQVINEFELWLDSPTKAYLDSQGISASSDMPFLVGLAYDKMGQSANAEYYYDQVSYLKYLKPDCLLVNRNFSWQSYNEVIKIMESGDNLETCHKKALYDYVVSKDIVTGQYYPPIQRTSLNEPVEDFVDPNKDPQHYVDRYNNELRYKAWFDENYPDITIYEAVGLPELQIEPEPEPTCESGFELFNNICYRIDDSVDRTLSPYYDEDDAGSLRDSIRYFHQNWEFEKALELTKKAKKYSDQPIYASILLEKSEILSKMFRHQEALDTFNEFDKRLESGYNIWNHQKGMILYNLGKYSSSVNVLESTLVEIQEKETIDWQKKFLTGIAMFNLGMAYEKLGDFELSDQAYDRASQDIVIRNLDCNKVRTLMGTGGYVEAMQILNNMDSKVICIHPSGNDSVESLKSFVQERINKYQSNSSIATSSSICGTGTIEKDGICVPDYPNTEPSSKGGGCLIATATYGSELAPQVQQLRELRDNKLLNTKSGTSFMESFNDFYYSFSPTIADLERESPVFREMVKIAITPMISSLSILNYVDMDSEAEVLGYGISLIILNIGMYVGIPAVVIVGIRNRF